MPAITGRFYKFPVGTYVEKTGGDYKFKGHVVSAFTKRSGVTRYVVENADGLLFIFNEGSLLHSQETTL